MRGRLCYWTAITAMIAAIVLLATFCRSADAQCGPGGCPSPFGQQSPQWRPSLGPQVQQGTPANHPAMCRIKNSLGNISYYGTGVLVDVGNGCGLVVSVYHTFRDGGGKVTCEFPGRGTFEAKLVRDKDGHDLAALLIRDPGVPPVDVAEKAPGVGEAVVAGGFGGDGRYLVRAGRVISMTSDQIVVSGTARQGDSGGPILDGNGRLIGVLWGTGDERTYGVACTRADVFLARAGRYLLPWNAEINDPARDPRNQPPQVVVPPGGAAPDLAPLADKLDKILAAIQAIPTPDSTLPPPVAAPSDDEIAEKAAAGALEKAGLLERAKEKAVTLIGWPHILGGAGLGVGGIGLIVAVGVWLIRKDLKARRTTGDPLAIEKVQDVIERIAGRLQGLSAITRNQVDDKVANAAVTVTGAVGSWIERVADKFAPKPAPPTPAEPPSPPAA